MPENQKVLPRHIGFIVDGNRRWAKKHGLPAYEGHLAGYESLKEVLLEVLSHGVEYASAYVFSTENWKRTEKEVSYLMSLLLKVLSDDLHIFTENQVRLRVVGSREELNSKLLKAIDHAEEVTRDNEKGNLLLCLNYGGHDEIVRAARKVAAEVDDPYDITIADIEDHLFTPDVPACDLIVRTSGEQRLSNFMLWRSAYSELLFIDKLWPEMSRDDVVPMLEEYERRNRRFGG